jgi:lysophospholipid acyltransferase (LPLAT)-like uncharacterized protein
MLKSFYLEKILTLVLYGVFMVWCKTLRIVVSEESKKNLESLKEDYLLALWHSRIFGLLYYLRGRPKFNILISPSADGDFLANLGTLLGYVVVRGSSFKKTVPATRSIFKALRRKEGVVIVADGSRGPRHKFQRGSLIIASKTGSVLAPMTFDTNWKIELNSWDKFLIPWPFAKCVISFGEPILLPQNVGEEEIQKRQVDLENKLDELTVCCYKNSQK